MDEERAALGESRYRSKKEGKKEREREKEGQKYIYRSRRRWSSGFWLWRRAGDGRRVLHGVVFHGARLLWCDGKEEEEREEGLEARRLCHPYSLPICLSTDLPSGPREQSLESLIAALMAGRTAAAGRLFLDFVYFNPHSPQIHTDWITWHHPSTII